MIQNHYRGRPGSIKGWTGMGALELMCLYWGEGFKLFKHCFSVGDTPTHIRTYQSSDLTKVSFLPEDCQ